MVTAPLVLLIAVTTAPDSVAVMNEAASACVQTLQAGATTVVRLVAALPTDAEIVADAAASGAAASVIVTWRDDARLTSDVRVVVGAWPPAADGIKTRTSLVRRASSRQVTITDAAAPLAAASATISASVGSAATRRTTVVAPACKVWTQAEAASFMTATLSGAVVTAMSRTSGAVTIGSSVETRKRPSPHCRYRDPKHTSSRRISIGRWAPPRCGRPTDSSEF